MALIGAAGEARRGLDRRGKDWIGGCVEVDTMPPAVLKGIVRDCITQHIDPYQWHQTKLIEAEEKETLRSYAAAWGKQL